MARHVDLPFNTPPFQNIDEIGLHNFSDSLFNGFIDSSNEKAITVKRDGLSIHKDIGTAKAIDGLFWWHEKSLLIVVTDGFIYKINEAGTATSITGDKLETSGRVSFAQNGTTLVMANGGRMVYTDGTANTAYIADADAPTTVSHVAFLDYWLIVNRVNTPYFYFADFINAPTVWLSIDVFTAEAQPDIILGLYVNRRIITIVGSNSIEFWANDGISPFVRLQGTTSSRGGMSKYSFAYANEVGYMLDDMRRFVSINGTNVTILSTPYDRTLHSFTTVDDCLANYISYQGRHFLKFDFPTENKSFVFDIVGNYWLEWNYFNSGLQTKQRFLGQEYAYAQAWNKHFFGSWKDSNVYEMKSTNYDDNGSDIHFEKTTGHIDHGLQGQLKTSFEITMRVKTGHVLSDNSQAKFQFSFRDENAQGFSSPRDIYLKPSSNTQFTVKEFDLGQYESRQYRIAHTDRTPFAIGSVTERLDVQDV